MHRMDMDHNGHEAFYMFGNESSPHKSNQEDQSDLDACTDDWTGNLHPFTILQSPEPRLSCSRTNSNVDALTLSEPGSLNLVNTSAFDETFQEHQAHQDPDISNNLENLAALVSRNSFSQHYSPAQHPNLEYPLLSDGNAQAHSYHKNPYYSIPVPYTQDLPMHPSNLISTYYGGQVSSQSNQLSTQMEKRVSQDSTRSSSSITGKRYHEDQLISASNVISPSHRSSKVAKLVDNQFGMATATISQNLRARTTDCKEAIPPYQQTQDPERLQQNHNVSLTKKQRKFIRHWHGEFANDSNDLNHSILAPEKINALAMLVETPVQPVQEYIQRKFNRFTQPHSAIDCLRQEEQPYRDRLTDVYYSSAYSLLEANRHLEPTTLSAVEKYVLACQRRRAQNDGRRSVNNGPFRCTFGCGYRTKRSFDWRRHEETHEPQELWLCMLCCDKNESNPFLVNRKDKFLRHAKDAHKHGWDPETVLNMSKVDFRANFDPKCPYCHITSDSWDDRCRHVLGHYEDEMAAAQGENAKSNLGAESDSASCQERSSVSEEA